MQSLFGMELTTAQKVIVASVVILVLLALLGLVVRQIQGGRLRVPGQAGGRQRQPRLGVVDTYDLDRQRQLILIRRDNVEHLLMVGGASDVVVESHIVRGGSRSTTPIFNEAAPQDRPLPPFETLVPPSEPALRAGEELRRSVAAQEPTELLPAVPMRPVQVPVETASAASAGFAAALGLEAIAPTKAPTQPLANPTPPLPGLAPSFAREHAPAPAVSPGELDDMTRQLEAALKRPFSAVRSANLHDAALGEPAQAPASVATPPAKPIMSPPKPANAGPAEELKPAAPVPVQPKAVAPMPVEPKTIMPPTVAPPKMPEPASAPVSAPTKPQSMLDMEAELEAALGLKPKATDARPSEPKPAAINLPPPAPVQPPFPAPEPKRAENVPPPVAKPADVPPAAAASKPEPVEAPAAAVPAKPLLPEPAAEPAKSDVAKVEPEKASESVKELDPFSVDAIEAEFARLLGRDPKKG